MFTILAFAFIVLLVVAVFYGYGIVMKRPPNQDELRTETCTLCRLRVDKSMLVERQVGDSHVYYFCRDCVRKLHDDLGRLPGV